MAGQLVQISCPIDFFPESVALVESQYQELVELRADRRRLERENLEFRQQVGYWKSRHRDALLRIAALEQKIEQLEGEKQQLHADLFGRRSETKPLNDRSNHLDDPQDDSQHPKRKRGPATGEPRTPAARLFPAAGPRGIPQASPRAMCLPGLRSTVTSPN